MAVFLSTEVAASLCFEYTAVVNLGFLYLVLRFFFLLLLVLVSF